MMKSHLVNLWTLAILLGSVPAYSQTVSHGEWLNSDGTRVSMECPQSYSELTRLPHGCINLLDGGGVIWTSHAFSQNEADLKRASKIIGGLKLNLSELRAQFESAVDDHSRKVSELQKEALRDIDEINRAHRASSIRSFLYGTAAGVVISAALVLLI